MLRCRRPVFGSLFFLTLVAIAGMLVAAPSVPFASTPAGGRPDGVAPSVYRCEIAGQITYSAQPCADGSGIPVAPLADSPEQRARAKEAKAELRAEQQELDRQRAAREQAEREAQRDRQAALRATAGPRASSVAAGEVKTKSNKRRATKTARGGLADAGPALKTPKKQPKKAQPAKRPFDPVHSPPRRKAT